MAEVDLREVTQQIVDEPFELSHCGGILHTGEVVGSIHTPPTIHINDLAFQLINRAQVSPKKTPPAKHG